MRKQLPLRWSVVIALAGPLAAQDVLAIVRKSVSHDQSNWLRAKDYTFVSRSEFREKDSQGNVRKTTQETREVLIFFGEPYRRLIEKGGKPLPPDEERNEQTKIDKLHAKRSRESDAERRRRIEAFEKERREERDFAREIPEAYNFRLVGEETIAGRKAWVVDATPKPEFKPGNWRAGMLRKFKGRMWIDQAEYQWIRLDGEAIDTVSFGLILARLAKGSMIHFEQTRINDEVWMPKALQIKLDARFALVKRMLGDVDVRFSNYRKFQSESRILSTSEIQ